jgi:hypothetical protein
LCFLPVRAEREIIDSLSEFTLLRVLRGMPRIRPVIRTMGSPLTFDCKAPTVEVLDRSIKAVIFDGGPVDTADMAKYVRNTEAANIGDVEDAYREQQSFQSSTQTETTSLPRK